MLKQIFLVRHYLVALVANGGTALEPRGAVGRRFGVETQVVVSGFYREWSTSLARLLNQVQSLCTRQVHDVTRHTKTRSYTYILHCCSCCFEVKSQAWLHTLVFEAEFADELDRVHLHFVGSTSQECLVALWFS